MKRGLALVGAALLFVLAALEVVLGRVTVPSFAAVRDAYRSSESVLLDRGGVPLQQVRIDTGVRRLAWTPLEAISPALVDTVVRSEDRRFFAHGGVDARAIAAATAGVIRGQRPRGASTLSMQLVRRIGSGARRRGERSTARGFREKAWQVHAAWSIESTWSKREILEAYLNLVDFRGEIQGVAAASRVLFGKAPSGIDRGEAAVLAALLRAPNADRGAVERRAEALAPAADVEVALARAFGGPAGAVGEASLAPHLARRLRERLAVDPAVTTTLDASAQRIALDVMRRQILAVRDRRVSDGAILAVDNVTGDVLAYVGGSGELSSARYVDGVQAPRQAGSALKPFLYALALEQRLLTAATLVEDTPLAVAQGSGLYRPENYDKRFRGLVSVRTALAGSLNVPAVRTAMLVGVEPFAGMLRGLGFSRVVEDGEYYGPALALGSVEVSLWELVDAYRALANGGLWSPLRVTASDEAEPASRKIASPPVAYVVSSMLADRESRSTTFGLESPLATPFWSAVKTGTSKDMRDNWCVGYTRRFTVGVWVGNFSGEPMQDVTGVTGAAPAWLELISALESRTPSPGDEPPPAGIVERGVRFPNAAEPPRREWFVAGTEPAAESSIDWARRARILSPTGGSIIARDPDIPASRQRVAFEAASARAGYSWRLDGRHLGAAGTEVLWEPHPGKHELALLDERGSTVDQVRFVVRPGS